MLLDLADENYVIKCTRNPSVTDLDDGGANVRCLKAAQSRKQFNNNLNLREIKYRDGRHTEDVVV